MSLPVSDDFNRGPNSDPIGANWTTALGSGSNFRLFNNQVFCDQNGVVEALTYWNADAAPADQSVSLTRVGAGNGVIGATARVSAGLGYGLWFDASGTVSKWTGGPSRTDLGTSVGFASGDRGTITVIGTGLELFKNGVSAGTFTDASIATGSFGMHGYVDSGTLADDFLGEAVGEVVPTFTVDFVSADGDGHIRNEFPATWDLVHDAVAGTSVHGGEVSVVSNHQTTFGLWRGFVPFDVALPRGAVVQSARLLLTVSDKSTSTSDSDGNDFVGIVLATPANSDALDVADFDQCGAVDAPIEVTNRILIPSMTVDVAQSFTLNAAGLAALPRTGRIVFGVREGHDIVDDVPDDGTVTRVEFYASDDGATRRPYLSVTYTVPPRPFVTTIGARRW